MVVTCHNRMPRFKIQKHKQRTQSSLPKSCLSVCLFTLKHKVSKISYTHTIMSPQWRRIIFGLMSQSAVSPLQAFPSALRLSRRVSAVAEDRPQITNWTCVVAAPPTNSVALLDVNINTPAGSNFYPPRIKISIHLLAAMYMDERMNHNHLFLNQSFAESRSCLACGGLKIKVGVISSSFVHPHNCIARVNSR